METVKKYTKYWLETNKVFWTPGTDTTGFTRHIPIPIHTKVREEVRDPKYTKFPLKFSTRLVYVGETYEVSVELDKVDCRLVQQRTYLIRNTTEADWPQEIEEE